MRVYEPGMGTYVGDAVWEAMRLAREDEVILVFQGTPVAVSGLSYWEIRQVLAECHEIHERARGEARERDEHERATNRGN